MPGMVVLAYIGIPSEYGWPVVLYWYLCARGTSVAVTYALEKTKPRVRAQERETKYEIILRADSTTMLERIGYRIQHNEVVLLLFLFSSTHFFSLAFACWHTQSGLCCCCRCRRRWCWCCLVSFTSISIISSVGKTKIVMTDHAR